MLGGDFPSPLKCKKLFFVFTLHLVPTTVGVKVSVLHTRVSLCWGASLFFTMQKFGSCFSALRPPPLVSGRNRVEAGGHRGLLGRPAPGVSDAQIGPAAEQVEGALHVPLQGGQMQLGQALPEINSN